MLLCASVLLLLRYYCRYHGHCDCHYFVIIIVIVITIVTVIVIFIVIVIVITILMPQSPNSQRDSLPTQGGVLDGFPGKDGHRLVE